MLLPKYRHPTHPGEMLLKEFLEPLGVQQTEFAKHLGWSYVRLNELINGKRGVSADSALALSEALGTTPDFWLRLNDKYEVWKALKRHKKVEILQAVRQHAHA
jgi:antitoxin HigA-1